MEEEKIRQAFTKAKQDIQSLQLDLTSIKQEIQELKSLIQHIIRQTDIPADFPTQNATQKPQLSAVRQINTTQILTPAHFSTDNLPLEALKSQNLNISIGNKEASTDKQTVKQTDTSTGNIGVKVRLKEYNPSIINSLSSVSEFINSLDHIKKELRQKIKSLTKQEMAVFTAVYTLEEKGFIVDYESLAQTLLLTQSSIRDYIQRILKKQIPLEKHKENNKKVIISIPQSLKKVVSLSTILQLREI